MTDTPEDNKDLGDKQGNVSVPPAGDVAQNLSEPSSGGGGDSSVGVSGSVIDEGEEQNLSTQEPVSPPVGNEFSPEGAVAPSEDEAASRSAAQSSSSSGQDIQPSKGALVKLDARSVAEKVRSDLVKKKASKKDLKRAKTLSEHKNWYKDRYQSVVIQRNVLFFLTALALFGLGFSVTAVATLNASKIFEPFVIEVEEKTGMVAQVDNKTVQKYTSDETVKNYFLAKYIRAREQYNFEDFRYFYYNVTRLLSSGSVYADFRGFLNSHPESPMNLGRGTKRVVEIKSIVFLEPKKVQIRISTKDTSLQGGGKQGEGDYIITLNFDFLDLNLTREGRYINPLGFQVTSYRRDIDKVEKGTVRR